MLRLRQIFAGSPSRWFVSTRGVSTGLALALALFYTKILGVEKRSVLAFIMVSALILTFIFISGISLALRNKPPATIKDEEYFGFLVCVVLAGILVGVTNCSLLLIYSRLKTEIPGPIYLVCFAYSFSACVALGYQDALVAMGNIKLTTFLDILMVVIQLFTMVFFIKLEETSLIISIFLSFIFSYVLTSFSIFVVVSNSLLFDRRKLVKGARSIVSQSRNQHLFGIANGLVDRVDRFLVGIILPFEFIAKYALLSSIISFARFVPDSVIKLNLFHYHEGNPKKSIVMNSKIIGITLLMGLVLVFTAQLFIEMAFGEIWLLPISVGLLYLVQEILRGSYQIKAINLIAIGGKADMSRMSLLLIIFSVSFISFGAYTFGIWGVPAAMLFVYLILILKINAKLKKFSHGN